MTDVTNHINMHVELVSIVLNLSIWLGKSNSRQPEAGP